MPLVFSTIVPHPPLLIPNIGKNEIEKVKNTKEAMEKDLYLSKPDILLIISPHGSMFSDAFTINAHTHFVSDFEQFGDLSTKLEWRGADHLAAHISHASNKHNLPVQLVSQERLDHGSTVPLYFLTQHLPNCKVLPIGYCGADAKTHLQFGELLKDIIMESGQRIAVIASGDLSHSLTTDAPAGYNKAGKEFDEKIIELLETNNIVGITNLDPAFVEDAGECGYRSFLILMGIVKNMHHTFKNYSYEGPFGVGYLVGNFVI